MQRTEFNKDRNSEKKEILKILEPFWDSGKLFLFVFLSKTEKETL